MTANPNRIYVRHHFLPPEFMSDLAKRNISWTGTGSGAPEWNVSMARETSIGILETPLL